MANLASVSARWRTDRLFYTGVGFYVAFITFIGFAPSFYLSRWMEYPANAPAMTPLLYAHGAVFTFWVVLAIVQPALIASRNLMLHRRLGYAAVVIAAAMVVLGNITAVAAMQRGFIGLGDPHAFYAIPFFAIQTFALFVILAVLWRNHADTHKRLILLAHTQIIEASVARLPIAASAAPFSFFIGADLIILAGITYDLWSQGRVHRVWIWGGAIAVFSQVFRLAVSNTEPWLAFARTMAAFY